MDYFVASRLELLLHAVGLGFKPLASGRVMEDRFKSPKVHNHGIRFQDNAFCVVRVKWFLAWIMRDSCFGNTMSPRSRWGLGNLEGATEGFA